MLTKCSYCEKEVDRPNRLINQAKKNNWKFYCTKECHSGGKTKHQIFTCGYCGIEVKRTPSELKSKSGKYFCSKSCSTTHRNTGKFGPANYLWKGISYRNFAFDNFPNYCNRCNYDEHKFILIVHHKDRNRKNNTLENLEILCPNCHAIEHYGSD